MIISLNYVFKRHGGRIPLYIFGSIFFGVFLIFLFSRMGFGKIAPCLIFGTFSIIFLVGAIKGSKKVLKRKKVEKNIEKRAFGELDKPVWNRDKFLTFYYELEDGRIGKTRQQITRDRAIALANGKYKTVPIIISGPCAIMDESQLEKGFSYTDEEMHIKEKFPKEIVRREKYGKMSDGVVFLAIGFLSIFASIVFGLYGSFSIMRAGTIVSSLLMLFIANPITPVFLAIGFYRISNHYFIKKIKEENFSRTSKPEYKPIMTDLVPLKNTDEKYGSFTKRNLVCFQYEYNGKTYQTMQSISGKARKIINERGQGQVEILTWKERAIVDEETVLNHKKTKIQKLINWVKEHDILFYVAIAINLYFFVTELIDAIGSNFTSGLPIFGMILYGMTLLYMAGMFLLEKFVHKPYYAYLTTIVFLGLNMIVLPIIYILTSVSEGMAIVTKVQSFFNTMFASILTIFVYTSYLFVKFIYAIIKSHQAKMLDEHYERCETFGDIVSTFYTFVVFIFHVIIASVFAVAAESAFITINNNVVIFATFLVLIIGMSILSLVLFILCLIGMIKNSKEEQPAQ